jgi:hypothetical protein
MDTFGFGTDTTNFSATVTDDIQKAVIKTLRAGLIALPKGAVVPATLMSGRGTNFTLRCTAYPDLDDSAATTPLSEGVAPTAVKLGIDTLDYDVAQAGAWTKVTDVAQYMSKDPLSAIARDKIARLAAQTIDNLALAAILAHAVDVATGVVLSTKIILDAKAILASRDVEPIPGVGFYCLTNPLALRGLEGEDDLNGYVDVQASADAGQLTKGAVGQYRGVTFLTSSRLVAVAGAYPVIFLGKDSIGFGDVSTITYHAWSAAGPGNELQQLAGVGFKGILGGKVLAFAETADGAGTNGAAIDRVYIASVLTGVAS